MTPLGGTEGAQGAQGNDGVQQRADVVEVLD
jgi:hypothetical protein